MRSSSEQPSRFAQEYDFGDLPAPYPTTLPNGARHLVTQALYMGNIVPDLESDGLPSLTANGDDTNVANDEDGINPSALRITAGVPYNMRVKVTNALVGNAWLHGFADWNHDGDFNDAGESTKVMVPGGSTGVLAVLSLQCAYFGEYDEPHGAAFAPGERLDASSLRPCAGRRSRGLVHRCEAARHMEGLR